MSEAFIGEIRAFGFNFPPKGWLSCNGQLLSVAQFSALFSLLGTTYGGDGKVTFGLPDLRGRFPMSFGNGPGLSPRTQGETGGQESTTLLTSNLPPHNHLVNCYSEDAALGTPQNNFPGNIANGYSSTSNATMAPSMTGVTGSGIPISVMPPYLVLNYCICISGIYPSRS